ncbi:phospholipase B1, membrane-associated-like isoform X2 [Hetaerina americana]
MGDSLTSANSAREESGIGVVIQDRGVSFSGGGLGTWREITTLPNIIKIFNPNLIGFARDRGDFLSENAQLNVAVPAALDDDIMNQVKLFIYKMKSDRRIDFNNHWKLLTIFIGHNDICSYHCLDREKHSPRNHALNLQEGLDYLYKHVPRIFVNIMSILDPTIATRGPFTNECLVYLRLFCACLFRTQDFDKNKVSISRVVRHYQALEKELTLSGRYDGREDFAVVIQPFMIFLNGPTNIGEPESPSLLNLMSESEFFWSRDCFHFNQRGLASASIHLWNNMVEPVGNKSMTFEGDYAEYKCPSKRNPYFFTAKNTATFYREGHQ